jgi:hypothetical protein
MGAVSDPTPTDSSKIEREPEKEPIDGLSERDHAILNFERSWWSHAGIKEEAIRDQFGISAARYYQLLGALIDSPAALVHDPMLVKRLQRVREGRAARRALRTQGTLAE